jgi:dipeptidyl aminopeptidase/acylaminoacyl peptidase
MLLAAVAGVHAMPALARPWRLADTLSPSMIYIGDVQIAPNGARLLVDVQRADLKANTFVSGYRLVDVSSGSWRAMPAGLAHPRWSPDGKSIAWIAPAAHDASRVLLTTASGDRGKALTASSHTIVGFAWSPSGSAIATVETQPARRRGGQRLHWMGAGNDFLDQSPPRRDLWKIDVATGRKARLTDDAWSYGGAAGDGDPSWSHDGGKIVAVRQPTAVFEDFDREQYVAIDVKTGARSPVVDHSFFAYPGSAAPLFSPTSDDIAYVRTWDGKLSSREDLFVGSRDVTSSIDRDFWSCGGGSFAWQPGMLVADMMDGASLRLFRIDPTSGAMRPLTTTDGSVETFSVARTGRIAYAWATPTQLPDVYVLDPGATPRRVTHFGSVPRYLPISPTRYVQWGDTNGHTLHGLLTAPTRGDAKRLTLVMEPHGGPQCADDFSFYALAQYLASNGYAYFRPAPRGSDGYGDWSYKAIVGDWGPGPMTDDLAGVDAVLASGVGDPNNLYIEGKSYGGYLTSWIVTHTNRFKAAVAAIPATDLLLDYTLTENSNVVRRFFGERPATDPELLASQSPLTFARAERTPLLIIIGLRDARAPYPAAIEFYKTVAENGAPARLLADPLAGHGPDDPNGVLAWQAATFGWLSKHGAPRIPDAVLPPE